VHREREGLVLRVHGEVDLATAPGLRAEALRALEDLAAGGRVVLDLDPVGYLASAGVGLVLELRAVAAARHAVLDVRTRPGSAPARALSLGGVAAAAG
jgi:anti-anti-sigma factor